MVVVSKVAQRREAKIASIVEAAWGLAREHGIQLVTLHALAKEVGMRQPSLYAYFDSKNALYDAMFADGNRQLIDYLRALDLPEDSRGALKTMVRAIVTFAVDNPERNALLFRRIIPGFEPSPESYQLAVEAMSLLGAVMAADGITDQDDADCVVAIGAGLIEAQLANEPTTDRWIKHVDKLIDLLADHANRPTTER